VLAFESVLELEFFMTCSVAAPGAWLSVSSGPAGMMNGYVLKVLKFDRSYRIKRFERKRNQEMTACCFLKK
jgi:hypothetical protein